MYLMLVLICYCILVSPNLYHQVTKSGHPSLTIMHSYITPDCLYNAVSSDFDGLRSDLLRLLCLNV